MLRVDTLEALFDAAETLAHPHPQRGEYLAITTNGGGAGVLAADAVALGGGKLAQLTQASMAALDQCLPATWSRGNPVDLTAESPVQRYRTPCASCLPRPKSIQSSSFMRRRRWCRPPTSRRMPAAGGACAKTWVLACWGWVDRRSQPPGPPGPRLALPASTRPSALWRPGCNWSCMRAISLPCSRFRPLADRIHAAAPARANVDRHGTSRRPRMAGYGAVHRAAQAYGIPVADTRRAHDAEEAVRQAVRIRFPVALKIISPHISPQVGYRWRGPEFHLHPRRCARPRSR